jgi:hypothetical protein
VTDGAQHDWILVIPSMLVIIGWVGSVIRSLLHRDRASIDKDGESTKAELKVLWGRIDTLRSEVDVCKMDVAVLKSQVASLPDATVLSERLDTFETKLEKRFERLEERFLEALQRR